MSDMIHVTMQYSNAVLVALLPHFSDFARKLDLPVPHPITTSHVQRFVTGGPVIEGHPIDVKGHLVLTNGYEFWYSWGHVTGFSSPRDYYAAQDVDRVPEFFGTLRLDQSEAVALARKALTSVGYAKHLPMLRKNPSEVRGPKNYKHDIIPHYYLVWRSEDRGQGYVKVTIDGEEGLVTSLSVSATNLWRTPPPIDGVPEMESQYRKRVLEGQQMHRRDPPLEKRPPQ